MRILTRRAIHRALFAAVVLSGSAYADPPQFTYRPLVASGSQTTQALMDAFANSYSYGYLASYNGPSAHGSPTVMTRPPPDGTTPSPCVVARARNSLDGILQLEHSLALNPLPGEDCLHVARTGLLPSIDGDNLATPLTFFPFATDAATFAVSNTSNLPRRLSRKTLQQIFTCQGSSSVKPLLPLYGSDLRRQFLMSIGLTDSPDFVDQPGRSCLGEILDHTSNLGLDNWHIKPQSVGTFIGQTSGASTDWHGNFVLGVIDGNEPMVAAQSVSYLHRRTSNLPNNLTSASLRQIYSCQSGAGFEPLLPPYGSAVRSAFLAKIGLTDSPDFVTQPGRGCVKEATVNGPVDPNKGTQVSNNNQLVPYDVNVYIAQIFQRQTSDFSAQSVTRLGALDNVPAVAINTGFAQYTLYNAVAAAKAATSPYNVLFDGPTSALCSNRALITRHGFLPLSNANACGSRAAANP